MTNESKNWKDVLQEFWMNLDTSNWNIAGLDYMNSKGFSIYAKWYYNDLSKQLPHEMPIIVKVVKEQSYSHKNVTQPKKMRPVYPR